MGFGFRKSFKVAPGVRLNVGKTRSSLSLGGKGLTANVSKRGVKTTVSIPKTGLSYSSSPTKSRKKQSASEKKPHTEEATLGETLIGFALLAVIVFFLVRWLF